MSLRPEVSVGMGLATATVVFAIYSQAMPSQADIRSLDSHNPDIAKTERAAGWAAGGTVAAISLLTKDATVFFIGGSMVIALSWWHRHSNAVSPMSGKLVTGITDVAGITPDVSQADAPALYSVPQSASYDVAF